MPKQTIAHYHQQAEHFQAQYDSVAAHEVHADWAYLLAERTPGLALDVGAGSGRDAHWMAQKGWLVTAVEPAQGLRELGCRTTGDQVRWADTQLPLLLDLATPAQGYDLILLSAVWMHLPAAERPQAFARLADLMAKGGLLIITLRFGPSDPARPMYPVSTEELAQLAAQHGLQLKALNNGGTNADFLQRQEVSWQTVCIQRPAEVQG
ncbi:class I SAM-dependent methyltransferase [Marinobacterium marinum]|uniref:Class I SAM-dependent methyltransferase n=1 Tax=Marinobacterium marinum TaxID=2756129 RepID=A0A7W2ADZ5_9GAMM|nr:class I SAM-dependent methyltransferase [Marinobacterium marinum]MBA4503698.1 class I SAM-dependent methyltransferase [Marinobacterium marinum]